MIGLLAWVGVGAMGAAGAYARFSVGAAITARRPGAFPWGTFVVNLTGGFTLGVLTGSGLTGDALFVLGTGFLGGYTTFSTWMVEAQRLGEDGDFARLLLYLLGSMVAGLLATGAGWALAEAIA
ncbi:MAG: fluoride exporter [Solirubrobacteraceae bacterium]|nr:fluoride exporter [Solirubrobacteraceae bacterium]